MDSVARSLPLQEETHDAAYRNAIRRQNMIAEIVNGLTAKQKSINPRYFYNDRGGELFERITRTDEYYLTRAENQILAEHAEEIALLMGPECLLVEPGAGSCRKVEYLLPELRPRAYLPMDVEGAGLCTAVRHLRLKFPWLRCRAIDATFSDLALLRPPLRWRRAIFFPGSTIGNFRPSEAIKLLSDMRRLVGVEGGILIGIDLDKDAATLNRAYNDSAGVTALFNLNVLDHINELADADFDSRNFRHIAQYNVAKRCVEMFLCSMADQSVSVAGRVINFNKNELIHTESSFKYSTPDFTSLASEAGLSRVKSWYDSQKRFAVHYFVSRGVSAH